MNKRLLIGVVLMITVALLLAVTVSATAAKPEEPYECVVTTVVINDSGHIDFWWLTGELDAYWNEEHTVLYNFCTATIPFGEDVGGAEGPGWRYATFNEVCEVFDERIECQGNTMYTYPEIWGSTTIEIYNPDTGEILNATDYYAIGDRQGNILFYKEYTP